ncbi:MAG: methyl-accepting chemotaxis protein [Syntrophaceae bacterium]
MKNGWKLREKLVVTFLGLSIIPLVIAIAFLGHQAKNFLEEQSQDYLIAKVDGFAMMVQTRYDSISGSIDIIKEQLSKQLKDDIVKQAAKEKYYQTGYMVIFQANGLCLYHPKAEFIGTMKAYETFPFVKEVIARAKAGKRTYSYTYNGDRKLGALAYNQGLDIVLWASAPAKEVLAKVNTLSLIMYAFLAIVTLIVIVVGYFTAKKIAHNVKAISDSMKDLAEGEGDLRVRLPVLTSDEVGDLAHWFNRFMENLEGVIAKVKQAASQVNMASQEVAAGSQGFSQNSQEQASAIEEVAATIEEMTSTIKHTAANADEGRGKAKFMVEMANKTNTVSQELITAMSEMSSASKKIGDITVTVNEVAFQTNLLALNAAVEAARAGEHGKGFAVVAEEVRALAQRSAEAARQIKVLIEDTVDKISAGDEMVKRSGEAIAEIIVHIETLSETMEEIATSSNEQARGVDELNRAVTQIDATTQQNAGTVEELSSTADAMSSEARELTQTVERFKVTGEAAKPKTAPVTRPASKPTRSATPARTPVKPAPERKPAALKPAEKEIISDNEGFEEF